MTKSAFRLFVILISLACLCNLGFSQQRRMTAQAIVKRMAQRYASCLSYQDTGVVETTHNEANSARVERMPFKTYFARPQFFRFEWIDYFPWKDGRKKIVWSDGNESYTYWEPDTYEKEEELGLAIAGATGISRGAAHTVPRLLIADEVSGFGLTELTNLSIVGEERFEGELCYRITGKHPFGITYELWIGKRDFLLRKVREESKNKDYDKVEEEIHRDIRLNEPIAVDVFNFKPPIALTESSKAKGIPEDISPLDEKPTWTELNSPDGGFKLLMPGESFKQTLTLETPTGKIVHNIYRAAKGGVICLVDYADFPKEVTDPATIKATFDEVRDELLKGAQAKLDSEATISLDGHPGREIKLILPGSEAKARLYIVNRRFYQLLIINMPMLNKDASVLDKFFESFKLVGTTKPVAVRVIEQQREKAESILGRNSY